MAGQQDMFNWLPAVAIGIAIAVAIALTVDWSNSSEDRGSLTVRGRPNAANTPEHRAERNESANVIPQRYSFDPNTKDPVIVKARTSFIATLNEMEAKNAKPLFDRRFEIAQIVGLAISAPTPEDVGPVLDSMRSILKGIDPAREKEVRTHLTGLYNQYVGLFGAKYQVVYATLRYDENTIWVNVNEFDDLAEAIPDENGIVTSKGRSHGYTSEAGWKTRYGDLIRRNENGSISTRTPTP